MKALGLLMLILGIATILGVAGILVPDGAGAGYWLSASWVGVLYAANWYVSTLIFSGDEADDRRTGNFLGVAPAIGITLLFYSFASLAFLAAYHAGWLNSKIHALAQLVALSAAAFAVLSAMLAHKGAKH